jgi:hypothetical protein
MSARSKLYVIAAGAVAVALAGFLLAWWMFHPKPVVVEVSAPAVRQADNSEVAKKEVVTTPPTRPHLLPHGSRVLRAEEIIVTPTPGHEGKELHVDATLVETKDGQTHLITSSPDGSTTATDTVVQDKRTKLELPKHHLTGGYNGAGLLAGYSQKIVGPFSVGVVATYEPLKTEKFRAYATITIDW